MLKTIPVSLDIYGAGDLEQNLQQELLHNIEEDKLNIRLMGRSDNVAAVFSKYHGSSII